jgi:hypothetical protein
MKKLLAIVAGTHQAPTTDRAPLKAAIAARAAELQEIADARAALERLQAVVDQADEASRAAAAATRAANDFRRAWVAGGCKHSESCELQTLEDAAQEAARIAERAEVNATAVRKEFARAQDAVDSRRSYLRGAEAAVLAARNAILVQEARSLLERYEAAADLLRDLRVQVVCLEQFLATEKYDALNAPNCRVIDDTLERARILPYDQERAEPQARDVLYHTNHERELLERYTAPWRARAAALLEDPDAE